MTLWIVIISLALAVTALLVLALVRQRGEARARADFDIAVYRDQLAGVERDLARGNVSAEVAERTRVEVSRRILEADRSRGTDRPGHAPNPVTYAVAGLVVLAVLGGSLLLYRDLGVPGYDDMPLKDRIAASQKLRETRPRQAAAEQQAATRRPPAPPADPQYVQLVEQLRTAVAERPGDDRGLMLLAQNEATLGNYTAAYAAQEKLVALRGDKASASDQADLADLMIQAAGGYVSPEAESALAKALELDPRNAPALYYSGLMYAQNGRADITFRIWRTLLENSAPTDPWVPAIRAQIEEAAMRAGVEYSLPPLPGSVLPGPGAADMQAAQAMTPEQRMDMIRTMVAGLSDRLATQGGSVEEWARLITSLGVLGEQDRAAEIWTEAKGVFAGNDAALAQLTEAASRAGLAP